MGSLEQKINDSEGKTKQKEPWELEARDFIPILGIFIQGRRMHNYHSTKIRENGGILLKELTCNFFHYLPRRALIFSYNMAVWDAVGYACYQIYKSL